MNRKPRLIEVPVIYQGMPQGIPQTYEELVKTYEVPVRRWVHRINLKQAPRVGMRQIPHEEDLVQHVWTALLTSQVIEKFLSKASQTDEKALETYNKELAAYNTSTIKEGTPVYRAMDIVKALGISWAQWSTRMYVSMKPSSKHVKMTPVQGGAYSKYALFTREDVQKLLDSKPWKNMKDIRIEGARQSNTNTLPVEDLLKLLGLTWNQWLYRINSSAKKGFWHPTPVVRGIYSKKAEYSLSDVAKLADLYGKSFTSPKEEPEQRKEKPLPPKLLATKTNFEGYLYISIENTLRNMVRTKLRREQERPHDAFLSIKQTLDILDDVPWEETLMGETVNAEVLVDAKSQLQILLSAHGDVGVTPQQQDQIMDYMDKGHSVQESFRLTLGRKFQPTKKVLRQLAICLYFYGTILVT